MKIGRRVFLFFVVVFVLIQFVPFERTNPKPTGEIIEPQAPKEIFRRACYDCHSYETRWPWYSFVAPVSWLIAHDVNEARKHLNFSIWEEYPPEDVPYYKKEIFKQVEKGEMPLPRYLLLHTDARLTPAEIQVIKDWTAPEGAKPGENQPASGGHEEHHH